MGSPDFDTATYKVLAYAYECLKSGVSPDIDKARELADANPLYFAEIMRSAAEAGYVRGVMVRPHADRPCPVVLAGEWSITGAGASFVDNDPAMESIRGTIGDVAKSAIAAAVQAAIRASLGF